MRNIKSLLFIAGISALASSCKKELDVKNPNNPSPQAAYSETGILNLAQGATYLNGFRNTKYSTDQLYPDFWGETITYHSIMGDETWNEAANEYMNQLGAPFQVTLDNGTVVINPNQPQSQITLIRQINQNSVGYANPLYYEWAYMYALNNGMNNVLSVVPNVSFSGDSTAKKATIQAWAYYWKGYAYSRIGSLYYAGVINSANNPASLVSSPTNGNYVSHQAMIAAANKCFDSAQIYIASVTDTATFTSVVGTLIPAIFQVGLGGPLSQSMLVRNINTMRARDLLMNNPVKAMTTAQWDSVLNYTSNGIQPGDYVFTARSDNNSTFMSAAGNLPALTTGDPNNTANFQVMERLIQDFQPGDYRFNNNFSLSTTGVFTYPDRSEAGGTRWQLLDGNPQNGITGDSATVLYPDSTSKYQNTVLFCNSAVGAFELYLAGTWEENQLMNAEANIELGNVNTGLQSIDAVRGYQGANLPPLAGSGLSQPAAYAQLRSERRIALMFRGFAFYDARRWGVIYSTANGGGRTGSWLIDAGGNLNVNATIDYNYLDYWDVPGNETAYNAAAAGSAPIINPAN
jgi:starch-binding outer membrane protein, SusD/RagB family